MAIYHCSCQVISAGDGRSSVAAAAYRSGSKLTNEIDELTHDYTHKQGVVYSEVLLPENAPEEYRDRSTLWNSVEQLEKKFVNREYERLNKFTGEIETKTQGAQLAREYEFSIPNELPKSLWNEFARNTAYEIFVKNGMIADVAVHEKEENGTKNPHVHVQTPMRSIGANGKWEAKTEQVYLCKNASGEERGFTKSELTLPENAEWKKQHHYSKGGNPKGKKIYLSEYEKANNPKYSDYERIKNDRQPKTAKFGRQNPKLEYWNSKEFLMFVRENVAIKINAELERMGLPQRVDHRSLKDQGIDREPQTHEGVAARNMEKKGKVSDRCSINREIKRANEEKAKIKKEISAAELALGKVNADIQWQEVYEGIDRIRGDVKSSSFDEEIQMQALERLDELEARAEDVFEAQSETNYHKATFYPIDGKYTPYLEYHGDKAQNDIVNLKNQICGNLTVIRDFPHYTNYTYGDVNVQDIDETFRADVTPNGLKKIVRRGEAERNVIRDAKQADRELHGLYDTTRLRQLIAEQNQARKNGIAPQKREEVLIRRIQDGFENLRFIERKNIFSYAQAQEAVKDLETKYAACTSKLSEARKYVERLENVAKAPHTLNEARKRALNGKDDPKYMTEQYPSDLSRMKACMEAMKKYNITDTESLKTLQSTVEEYREKIEKLQNMLVVCEKELEAYKHCEATLERIARGREFNVDTRLRVPERQPVSQSTLAPMQPEPARAEPRAVPFDVATVARQLEAYRSNFIKASVQAQGWTFYQENPIYRQQSAQIAECAGFIKDYIANIESLTAEKSKLGLWQGKQKKALQEKIDNFGRLLREKEDELKTLGVSDPARADEAIKEKNALAAEEKAKAQTARDNAGASTRAIEAKTAYLELAKTVPESEKQAVLTEMQRCRMKTERGAGSLDTYMAEINAERTAEKELDVALKTKQERGIERQQRTKKDIEWGE